MEDECTYRWCVYNIDVCGVYWDDTSIYRWNHSGISSGKKAGTFQQNLEGLSGL